MAVAPMRPPGIRREKTKDLVARRLRDEIVQGRLEPGAKLNLKAVADRFDVSMTPIREAFEQLAAEGLIRIDPYKGASVTALSADEYEEIHLLRRGLEGLAHRLGAERIDDAGCQALEACLKQMERAAAAGDVGDFIAHDRNYHHVIYRASGRQSLQDKLWSLRFAAERYSRAAFGLPRGGMADTVASHWDILDACKARDGERAETLFLADLRLTYDSFVDAYKREDADD